MSIACHQLQPVYLRQEAMWGEGRLAADFDADVVAATAVLENQTVNFAPLADPDKDKVVKVEWFSDCSTTVSTTCPEECDITGGRADRNCKEYELTKCASLSFSVPVFNADRTDNDLLRWENEVAKLMLRKKKLLAEQVAKDTIVAIEASKGTNVYTGGIGSVSGTTTTIAAANMNLKAMSYFSMVKAKNKFASAYLLNGDNLWHDFTNANLNAGNSDGAGDAQRAKLMKMYWDLFNMAAVSEEKTTYMIDPSALALVHKARNSAYSTTSPKIMGGKDPSTRWSEDLMFLPGVKVDVKSTTTCNNDIYFDNFLVTVRYDHLFAPERCDAANTGILKFECA
jgi:hypothetical protein